MIMATICQPNGRARYFEFLIDTGADYTLISRYDAALLGIDYAEIAKEETKVEAANLSFLHTKKVNLIINIEKEALTVTVLIAKEDAEALLGREGVFKQYDVLFQKNYQQVVFIKNQ